MSETAEDRTDAGTARRELILDQAEALFAEHGFHGVALSKIAAAAGLGNAGLIHHFPTKAKLYRTVLERVAAGLDARLREALEGRAGPAERLRAFIDVQIEWVLQRPRAFRLIQRELIDNRERVAGAHALPLAGFVSTGIKIIADAQQAGLLASGPTALRLSLVIGALTYAALVRPTFRQILPDSSVGEFLADDRTWLKAVADDLLGSAVEPRTESS
jgi:AcrR family transcriptional regulator